MQKKKKSEELKKYVKYLKEEAKKFRLTHQDLSNLYDLFYIVDCPYEIQIDFRKTLEINKMNKWFDDFHMRVEEIVIPELHEQKKEVQTHGRRKSTKTSNDK
jgi:hypothetical protein